MHPLSKAESFSHLALTRRDSEIARSTSFRPSSPENPLGPGLLTILEVGEVQPSHSEFAQNLGRAVALASEVETTFGPHFRGKGVPHRMFGVFSSMRYNLGNSSLADHFWRSSFGPHLRHARRQNAG